MKRRSLLLLVATIFSTTILCQQPRAEDLSQSIVGVWKLVIWSRKQMPSGNVEYGMGANPSGLVIYTRGGRILTLATAEDRKATGVAPMNDQDRAQLFKTMYSFNGTYKVEGNKLAIKVENSWNRAWNGTTLSGTIDMQGNKYTFTSAPTIAAKDGVEVIFIHTFERVE